MSKGQASLVIVEDEPVISLLIEEMAVDLGWRVEGCAYSEMEAFALLERCRPDLALLDVNLGSGNSLGVATACRSRGIPIVFVTGYAESDIVRSVAGAPILSKPFTPEDLAGALARGLMVAESNGSGAAPEAPAPGPG